MNRRKLSLVFGFAVLTSVAQVRATICDVVPTGTIRHDVADSQYTGFAASYPSVGLITWPGYLASGTLIAPTWVLTAAHVVDDSIAATNYSFNLTASGGGIYSGKSKAFYPLWDGSLSAGYDIGLLELSAPVVGIAPAILNTSMSELREVGVHVGYGVTGTGVTGYVSPAGTKRAGENIVDVLGSYFGWSTRIMMDDFDSPTNPGESRFGSNVPLSLEYCIAPGDSGGGLFIDFGSGPVLAGVHSFLAWNDGSGNADYGDMSGSIRVSQFNEWITENVTAVPEPTSLVAFASLTMTGIGIGAWRRRRKP